MDVNEVRALFDHDERLHMPGLEMLRQEDGPVVRHVPREEDSGLGFVVYSALEGADVDAVITRQVDYFRSRRTSFEWKLYDHDRPADLAERLEAHGFSIGEREAVMVLDLQEAPPELLAPVTADVRRIKHRSELLIVADLLRDIWDDDFSWLPPRLGGYLEQYPGFASIYLVYSSGQPACAAWTFFAEGSRFASLWGGSTLPDFRQQGLYTAVLATRVQEALARGRRYLTIDAGPMSRPIVAKRGFQQITTATECQWRIPE